MSLIDINMIINLLFVCTLAWVRSIEVRLRSIPKQTKELIDESDSKIIHRIERLEDRIEKILENKL